MGSFWMDDQFYGLNFLIDPMILAIQILFFVVIFGGVSVQY